MNIRYWSLIVFGAAVAVGLSFAPTPAAGQGQGKGKGNGGAAPVDPRQSQAVPRLPNGKPDLSGIWDHPRTFDLGKESAGCVGTTPGCTWKPDGPVPFTEFGKAEQTKHHFDYGLHCLPWGYVRSWGTPYPVEIIQNNIRFDLLFEQNNMFHIVPTDGTALPGDGELQPTWMGQSVGHWDGDALVVETKGFNGQTWLDTAPETPAQETTSVVERFTRPDFTHLIKDTTISDPKMYSKAWHGVMTNVLMKPGSQILEYSCDENNKELLEGHVTDEWTKKK